MFRLAAILALVIGACSAQASERIALIIGNSAYGTVSALENPANDARLMQTRLEELGFRVTALVDSDQVTMKRAIAQFGRDLRTAGEEATGLFFYAGHGVQSFGSNYLLPVDIALSDPADLDLMAVEARSVLYQMASARNRTNIVILDACRNNPFADIADFSENGLAEMKAPTGTYLAYATDPGGVALDGTTGNSPFTTALAQHMTEPGLPLEQVFKRVRNDVLAATNGQQTPWDSSSLTENFAFAPEQPQAAEYLANLSLWNSVEASGDPVQIMLFLRAYPDSEFAPRARELLQEALAEDATPDASPLPPSPADALTGIVEPDAEPKPQPAPPSGTDESLMFDMAMQDGSAAAFRSYLDVYPDGEFAQQAQARLAALEAQSAATETAAAQDQDVTFNSPLADIAEILAGQTIASLIEGTPLFPPIEGLPAELWQDQSCSSCHNWSPDSLCEQATTYVTASNSRGVEKQHPYGGGFKLNLRRWAAGGCQP